jgi:hypothetical protein
MKKWMGWLIPVALLAGVLLMAGCFASPTDPHAGAFTSVNNANGGGNHGGVPTVGPTAVVTAVPTVTPGGSGSISGTISGTTSGTITVTATSLNSHFGSTTIAGAGAYTISGLADTTYYIGATDTGGHNGAYLGTVVISGGNSASGINFTMH